MWPPRGTRKACPYKIDERTGNVYENKGSVRKDSIEAVTPAKAGVRAGTMDSRFLGNDVEARDVCFPRCLGFGPAGQFPVQPDFAGRSRRSAHAWSRKSSFSGAIRAWVPKYTFIPGSFCTTRKHEFLCFQ